MKIDKSLILSEIKSHYNFKRDADFARFLEIKPQTLASWHTRNTIDYELISAKCVDINANWLLTGNGEMLKSESGIFEKNTDYREKYIELLEKINFLHEKIEYLNEELIKAKNEVAEKATDARDVLMKTGS